MADPEPLSRAARWYRRLLLLFPFEFRRDYGEEMSSVFAEQHRGTSGGGPAARGRLWADTLAGALQVGPRRHLAAVRQDVRYALRTLRNSPGFTIAAVLALGLGVGANAAVFGLVNAVLLNPLAIEDASRVLLIQLFERKDATYTAVSTDNFRDIRERQRSFSQVAGFSFVAVTLEGRGEPRDLFGSVVSGNYFDLLGVRPRPGRAIRADEDRDDAGDPVAVLSHRLWTTAFARDPSIVGRDIRLNGRPFTVVGIAPEDFRGTMGLAEPDLYVPLGAHEMLAPGAPWSRGRLWRWINVVGRLNPGVTPEQADHELRAIGDRLAEEFPQFNNGRTLAALPLNRLLVGANDFGSFARAGLLLMAIVATVLIVACVNLANLMLARAAARARDLALRVAIGASRGRLVRQVLTESLLLGLAGGLVGIVLAHWTHQALWAVRPQNLEQPGFGVGLDPGMLAFALVVSIAASLLFGLAPALQVSRTDVTRVLNEAGRQPGLGRSRMRTALVVGEVAMAVVAVAAAGLFVRGLMQAQRIDPGFESANLMTMTYRLPAHAYDGRRARLVHEQLADELSRAPHVRAAAVSDRGLLQAGLSQTINVVGQAPPPGALGFLTGLSTVTPGYFDTAGIPVVAGRGFDASDAPRTRPVAIVNETMARRFWEGRSAVGERFTARGTGLEYEIVGVARDAKYERLGETPQPFFYLAILQHEAMPVGPLTLLVAGRQDTAGVLPSVRASLERIAPGVGVDNVATAEELIAQALWAPRTTAALVSAFGVLALLLATVGVYSVMAYSVTHRTQEIGLRMALGATPAGILAMIVRRGMVLAGLGIVLGTALTMVVAGSARGMLYGFDPRDPLTFIAVAGGLAAVSLVACAVPARRAARLDPALTLRG